MRSLKDFELKNKRVLLRCDFQVPLSKEGDILDDFKIKAIVPTVEYLIAQGAKIILMSHLKPAESAKEAVSLKILQPRIEEILNKKIQFLDDSIGEGIKKRIEKIESGDIVLLENLRFYKEEEENNEEFARKLANLGDIYVNDAFSVSHREHASVVRIPKYLPSAAGFLLEKEIKILSKVLQSPTRPLVVIIGGAKISTKIKVIENFLKVADHLILGGEIANAILGGKGLLIGKSLSEPSILAKIEKISLTDQKLHLPLDGIIALKNGDEQIVREGAIGTVRKEEGVFDIGPESIIVFKNIIKTAKMILWNGPLGLFEDKRFERGTKEIGEEIVRNHSAFKIIGGGETIQAANSFGLLDKFDHISTGGGAMLEFLSGNKLPGIEALA